MQVSIIIPTYNRASVLTRCLKSIADGVAGHKDIEVLIVDNGSTDGTDTLFQRITASYPQVCWRYFYDDMPGLLTGRHRGAAEARGEILAYLDDDILITPSWLGALCEAFRDRSVTLAGGPSLPQYEVAPPSWLDGLWSEFEGGRTCAWLSLNDSRASNRSMDPCWIWGLNFAIRKSLFHDCGGFHPDCLPKALQRYQG